MGAKHADDPKCSSRVFRAADSPLSQTLSSAMDLRHLLAVACKLAVQLFSLPAAAAADD